MITLARLNSTRFQSGGYNLGGFRPFTCVNGTFCDSSHTYVTTTYIYTLTNYLHVVTIMSNCKMPHWHKPTPENIQYDSGLHVMNSLTRNKDKFVTMDGDRKVRWYM